jgi:hypothetical protein
VRSSKIFTTFWDDAWNAHEPDAVDRLVVGNVVWTVDDGTLQRGWVEQASFEPYHWLLRK